jgi:division protein CdvB (Snf7/Vps24/ESCRT-III family)
VAGSNIEVNYERSITLDFKDKWLRRESGLKDRLKSRLKPKKNIRSKIIKATRRIDKQARRLDRARVTLREKDKRYYNKVVKAVRVKNKKRAALYANELAEVRRAMKSIHQARLALEQISLRLGTLKDVGDIAVTLAPAISVIRSIRGSISGIMPQAERDFDNLFDLLNSIMMDARLVGGIHIDFSTANMEAENILRQAEEQVKEEMREKLPPVPHMKKEGLIT